MVIFGAWDKRKKLKLPLAAATPYTLLFLLPKGWALVQLREGNQEERGEVEGNGNYFTSIKKKVRRLILIKSASGHLIKDAAATGSGCSEVPVVGSRGQQVGYGLRSPLPLLPGSFFPRAAQQRPVPWAGKWDWTLWIQGHWPRDETAGDWGSSGYSQGQSLCPGVGQRQPLYPVDKFRRVTVLALCAPKDNLSEP